MRKTIVVKDLKKTFKTHKRGQGLKSAFKSLFRREYEIKRALKGISFEIEEGEIVGFIGPNGAGKSTTIKALSGVLYPTSGELNVLGYTPWKDRVKYVKNIGVVFGQKSSLIWDLPAVDSFYLSRDLYDVPHNTFEKRLKRMTRILGVQDIIKTPVRDLSLGERMKCEVISALLHNPKLVFLDEPTIGLDVVAKDKLRDFILDVNEKEKTTFIITTHDMGDIERLCKRIIIINHGSIIYDGAIADIKSEYLRHKHLDIKFASKIKSFKAKGCKVLERSDYELKLELDTKKETIKNTISMLMSDYDVAEILVQDPPFEEIIQKVFKR